MSIHIQPSGRVPLPGRRYNESTEFSHLGIHYNIQVGVYPDGRVGVVFLQQAKSTGSFADTTARDVAILISMAIQHGCEIEHMLGSITKDENGNPEGLAGSLLVHLRDWTPKADGWGSAPMPPDQAEKSNALETISRAVPQQMGFTGEQCANCNSMHMKVSGHCSVCTDCGTTTGCS